MEKTSSSQDTDLVHRMNILATCLRFSCRSKYLSLWPCCKSLLDKIVRLKPTDNVLNVFKTITNKYCLTEKRDVCDVAKQETFLGKQIPNALPRQRMFVF